MHIQKIQNYLPHAILDASNLSSARCFRPVWQQHLPSLTGPRNIDRRSPKEVTQADKGACARRGGGKNKCFERTSSLFRVDVRCQGFKPCCGTFSITGDWIKKGEPLSLDFPSSKNYIFLNKYGDAIHFSSHVTKFVDCRDFEADFTGISAAQRGIMQVSWPAPEMWQASTASAQQRYFVLCSSEWHSSCPRTITRQASKLLNTTCSTTPLKTHFLFVETNTLDSASLPNTEAAKLVWALDLLCSDVSASVHWD